MTYKNSTMLFKLLGLVGLLVLPVMAYNSYTQPVARECAAVEMYTSEWFLDHIKPGFEDSLCGSAMFYSRNMSRVARNVALSLKKVTIWNVWPDELYNHENVESNPLRCIHNNDTQRQTFFENMSRAFAKKACGSAVVLHSSHHYREPPRDGIWATIEEPELTRNEGPVDWLRKVRMHPEFPQPANDPLSEKTWLKSSVCDEWLRSLLIDEVIAQWSEVFWIRGGTGDRHLVGRGGEREQIPLRGDRPDLELDPKYKKMSDLGFFDDVVDW